MHRRHAGVLAARPRGAGDGGRGTHAQKASRSIAVGVSLDVGRPVHPSATVAEARERSTLRPRGRRRPSTCSSSASYPRSSRLGRARRCSSAAGASAPSAAIRALEFVVDGEPPAGRPRTGCLGSTRSARCIPWLDPFAPPAWPSIPSPARTPASTAIAAASGALVRIAPAQMGAGCRLSLRAELAGGERVIARARSASRRATPIEPAEVSSAPRRVGTAVAIAMATYNPPRRSAGRASSTRSGPRRIRTGSA